MVAKPESSAACVASLTVTDSPALAHAIAMPPPIVPAPTIATLAIGRAAVCGGSPAILPDARSAKKRWMSAFACSVSTHSKNSARSRSQPSSNGSDAAASIASTALNGATWWRRIFAASCRADANSAAFSSAVPRFSERSRVLRTRVVTRNVAREADRPFDEIALDDAIDQAGGVRVTRLERLSGHAHVQGFLDADETRQPLRALGAWNDPEVDLGLADERVRHGDTEVAGHGDLETAAERRAVNRHDHGLAAVLDARQQRVHVARRLAVAPRRTLEAVDIGAGDERPARAHEHDRRHRLVALRGVEGLDDGFGNAGTERIDGRIVDGDDRDGVSDGGGDWIGH